ncbi:hypothetical protein [Streptomyces sp. NRRL S-87]|uniref:hypothetical protein n=1 Tax=Streptomyces sp. NRRL S-87 TaxID=1463920 RepID=UPI0004C117C0|nr:hypothetical protein [Streptomyces sp. NRRL S-87]
MSKPFRMRRTVLAVSSLVLLGAGVSLPATALGATADDPQQIVRLDPGEIAEFVADEGTTTVTCGDVSGTDSAAVKKEVKQRLLEKLREKLAD